MAKKRTPKKTARKPATKSTKGTGKKPTRRPLAKPTKRPARKVTRKPAAKSAKSPATGKTVEVATTAGKPATEPTKSPVKDTTIEAAATTSSQATEEASRPEHTWVVWQDGRGIWAGTLHDFKHSKRPDTVVCDVIDRGSHLGAAALHRAIQLGETLRQTYASHMKSWLHYDDAAQRQRIQEWYDRLGDR